VEIWTRSAHEGPPPGRVADQIAQEVLAKGRAAAAVKHK
jgi:hypothetical protein